MDICNSREVANASSALTSVQTESWGTTTSPVGVDGTSSLREWGGGGVVTSFEDYTELPIEHSEKILSTPWYNSSRTTVIFCHGFTGHPNGPAVSAVTKAYLEQGESNVVLLNWQHMASIALPSFASSYLNWAAPNARQIGVRLADVLVSLSASGLNLNKTHLVGHSLGAQIFGIAGNNLQQKGMPLARITGLDPASVGFEGKPAGSKLNPYSARRVFVIHSDPSKYGYKSATGTVDFWPNFTLRPVIQPGCTSGPTQVFSADDLCNHNRSWQLLVDAIKYPGTIIGSYAKNYRTWKRYSQRERHAVTLALDPRDDALLQPGNYFFVTKAEAPYGLGRDGL
ncbi:lipase member H-A-like [Epargyreus clarus]|uniref:lipase member H-A-like n=1 Tax=Epargyreus clarus TaxID=520877 RepID=UPI003C30CE9C